MFGFDENSSTAQRIKFLRNQAGMNQVDFADYLGVALRKLRSWEQGTRNPSTGVEDLIQRVLIAENMIPCPSPTEKYSVLNKNSRHHPTINLDDFKRLVDKGEIAVWVSETGSIKIFNKRSGRSIEVAPLVETSENDSNT